MKRLFLKCKGWLAKHRPLSRVKIGSVARAQQSHSGYQEYVLREKVKKAQADIHTLEFQLTKLRADNFELRQKFNGSRDAFAGLLAKEAQTLRSETRFDVRKTQDGEVWEVVTATCCLGSCDMGVYEFPTERDALLFAALLKAAEYTPSRNTACPSCYAEHMKDSV